MTKYRKSKGSIQYSACDFEVDDEMSLLEIAVEINFYFKIIFFIFNIDK
jgi:hypothetical protein